MTTDRTLVLLGDAAAKFGGDRLPARLQTEWTVRVWRRADGRERLAELCADAAAGVGGGLGSADLSGSGLRLLQIPFAGHDWLKRERLPAGCVVCNAFEHEIPIAEYVLLGVLEWEIGLRAIDADFRAGNWTYCMPEDGPFHGEAYGKTLGLIGYGHIGREVAARAAAFGMRTVAVAPSERPTPAGLGWLGVTGRDLDRLLDESDYIVVTCPLNEHTAGLLGEAQFARMKPSAVVINVARGGVIDEQALYRALADRRIRGAMIDTWYRYPFEPGNDDTVRPSRLPFHELDNLLMTPHCSCWTDRLLDRRWRFVAANLDRFARGEPLQNVVHP